MISCVTCVGRKRKREGDRKDLRLARRIRGTARSASVAQGLGAKGSEFECRGRVSGAPARFSRPLEIPRGFGRAPGARARRIRGAAVRNCGWEERWRRGNVRPWFVSWGAGRLLARGCQKTRKQASERATWQAPTRLSWQAGLADKPLRRQTSSPYALRI